MSCPPYHATYPSRAVAANAAELHRIAYPACGGFGLWACGDHWHVGHTSSTRGRACKRNPQHRATRRRIARATRNL